MTYKQEPPFAIQIEPTEGCNLRCSFCGIRGIRESTGNRVALSGPYKFMQPATAAALAAQVASLGWNPRIEFAMHGEPTANPELPAIVRAVRSYLPRVPVMLTTNAIPLLSGWPGSVIELFQAGVDTIGVDDYKPYKARESVLGTRVPGVRVLRYPQDGNAASIHRRPVNGERRLVLVEALDEADIGNHSKVGNHAGAAFPPDTRAAGKRCAKPFREMSVRWDGSVAICCNDWRGTFKLGNVNTNGVAAIWWAPAMEAARRHLYRGRRVFAPCQGCTHTTYRNGLLPDKRGTVDLPMPTTADRQMIDRATAGETYTLPVLRKWEQPA